MKCRTLGMMIALLACATFSYASVITDFSPADDGDGVITCNNYGLVDITQEGDPIKEYAMEIYGDHNRFETGHILGDITTLTEDDPRVNFHHMIDNETLFTWTDYHAEVTMSKSFTFDKVSVQNEGWTYNVTDPVQVGSDWVGKIDYYAGVPIGIGNTLDFKYRITFIGSSSYLEALTPTPEPGTLVLLACGLVGLFVARRRFAR